MATEELAISMAEYKNAGAPVDAAWLYRNCEAVGTRIPGNGLENLYSISSIQNAIIKKRSEIGSNYAMAAGKKQQALQRLDRMEIVINRLESKKY